MKVETSIKEVLKVDFDQAENNTRDFLSSLYAMGIVLVDKEDVKEGVKAFSNDFIIEQYLSTFSE